MSEDFYKLLTRAVDGQDIEIAGVQVTIAELNELVLFRCPMDSSDQQIEALSQVLNEAYHDMDPRKIIIARGSTDLRLERVVAVPEKDQLPERKRWLKEQAAKIAKELAQLDGTTPALNYSDLKISDMDVRDVQVTTAYNGMHHEVKLTLNASAEQARAVQALMSKPQFVKSTPTSRGLTNTFENVYLNGQLRDDRRLDALIDDANKQMTRQHAEFLDSEIRKSMMGSIGEGER